MREPAFEPVPVFGWLHGPSELFTGGATEAVLRVFVGVDAGGSSWVLRDSLSPSAVYFQIFLGGRSVVALVSFRTAPRPSDRCIALRGAMGGEKVGRLLSVACVCDFSCVFFWFGVI